MANIAFWSGMTKRVGLKVLDKLMVGNVDNGEPEYIDIADLIALLNNAGALRKDGYRWVKGDGNVDLANYQINDEVIGEGIHFPGYKIHGFLKVNGAVVDPVQDIFILSSQPI